jgi:hypothetical protein
VLTLAQATVVRPPMLRSVESWVAETQDCLARVPAPDYRGVTTLLFDEIDGRLPLFCDPELVRSRIRSETRFRAADDTTLSGLAEAAVHGLVRTVGAAAVKACDVAIYSTSGVDEAYLQSSTIGRLASQFGFSQTPHLGLLQLQGASLPGAIDLIEAMLPDRSEAAALFVATEKWPVPFPRVVSDGIVLGDAAAALWICRSDAVPGLQVVGSALRSCEPFIQPDAPWHGDERPRLVSAAADLVADCLHEHGIAPAAVSGWICSGLGAGIDRAVRQRVGVAPSLIAGENSPDGYLSAAAIPVGAAEVLDCMRAGGRQPDGIDPVGISPGGIPPAGISPARIDPARIDPAGISPVGIDPDGIIVTVGVSFGGSVGVLLLRPVHGVAP